MRYLFLVLLFCSTALISNAQSQADLPDTTDLEAYFDGAVTAYMEENDLAGATLGIVKDGETVLKKGYGFSDISNRESVEADSTLFRIGSVTKMFVWTAAMQLAGQDKLDLDENVNNYIEAFQIPDTYEEPITMRHLMTHTPGFEERGLGLFARDSTAVKSLEEILPNEIPARVREPGTLASYSNHGSAIAAHVIEEVSGQPFNEYVEEHILQPLDMNATSLRQPLPEHLADNLSHGYAFEGGEFKDKPFEYVPLAPAGAASSTAGDMIKFMEMFLSSGTYENTTVLDSATTQKMQEPFFRHHEEVNPMRGGFIDMSQNGVTIFGHGGDTIWFHSVMALFPEQDMGIFLSFNSEKGGGKYNDVIENFVDRYFSESDTAQDSLAMGKEELENFSGDYRGIRYPHERFTKVMALAGSESVSVTEKGKLKTYFQGEIQYWEAVDSLSFREENSSESLAFQQNESGEITHMFVDELPMMAFEKVDTISGQTLHLSIFGITAVGLLITLFYWPTAYFIRRKYRPDSSIRKPLPLPVKSAAWGNALLLLVFYLAFAISLGGMEGIFYGLSTFSKVLFALPVISVGLTLLMAYYTWTNWKYLLSGWPSRMAYTLLTLVFIAHLWQLYYWNILGFQF